jgi:hypothetical protein
MSYRNGPYKDGSKRVFRSNRTSDHPHIHRMAMESMWMCGRQVWLIPTSDSNGGLWSRDGVRNPCSDCGQLAKHVVIEEGAKFGWLWCGLCEVG